VLEKLARVREALEKDKEEMAAVVAERDQLRAENEALKQAASKTSTSSASDEDYEELKKENERLLYRIDHLCRALDELNKKAGIETLYVPAKP